MEQTNLLNEFQQPSLELASVGQRLANYLLDMVVFYILVLVISVPLGMATMSAASSSDSIGAFIGIYYLITFGLLFAYYTFLEGSRGKTIGKMVTKTRVVMTNGEPITYGKAFMRTLCRLVPFEFISAFIGPKMWHDQWVDTMVVKDK